MSSTIAVIVLLPIRQHGYYSLTVQMGVLTILSTSVLEKRPKATIHRTLELAFLNHHVRNALVQISMSKFITDSEYARLVL